MNSDFLAIEKHRYNNFTNVSIIYQNVGLWNHHKIKQ